jgi:hypothetical protein
MLHSFTQYTLYRRCWDEFQKCSSPKHVKNSCISTNIFRSTAPTFAKLIISDFYLEASKMPNCIQLQYNMKVNLTKPFLMPVKPFATAPGPLKECNKPWLDVSMRALIQVEDILSICSKFWIVKKTRTQHLWNLGCYCLCVMSVVSTVLIVKVFMLEFNSLKACISEHIFLGILYFFM